METKALSENDSKWNFESKFFLLEAEKVFAEGNVEVAAAFYDKATCVLLLKSTDSSMNKLWPVSAQLDSAWIKETSVEHVSIWSNPRGLHDAWGAKRKVEDVVSLLSSMMYM